MYKTVLYIVISLLLFSCGAKKKASQKTKRIANTTTTKNEVETILAIAQSYQGTPYKYGGIDSSGMDCSGLIYTTFKHANHILPRTTKTLSKTGHWIDLKKVKPGDLLFFATQKNTRKINHVAIVTHSQKDWVEFIHSTSSKGVITSNLKQKYWYFAFVQARRVLN